MTLFWIQVETMVLFKHNPQSSRWKNFHAKFTTSFSFKQTLKKNFWEQIGFLFFLVFFLTTELFTPLSRTARRTTAILLGRNKSKED